MCTKQPCCCPRLSWDCWPASSKGSWLLCTKSFGSHLQSGIVTLPSPWILTIILNALAWMSARVCAHDAGSAWELLESLPGVMAQAGMGHVLLAAVGDIMRPSLALANASMEFLARARQARVYAPADPFPFNRMVQVGHSKSRGNVLLPGCVTAALTVVCTAVDSDQELIGHVLMFCPGIDL